MPFPKQCSPLRKKSNTSSTEGSSHAVSEDSLDGRSQQTAAMEPNITALAEKYPVGTLVKKYMNGHGWCEGSVIGITPQGEYRVRMQHNVNADSTTTIYPPTAMPRLTKTAKVREGSRVTILWPAARTYYPATVRKENPRKRENFQISYDGQPNPADREWIDLHRHRFRLLTVEKSKEAVAEVTATKAAISPKAAAAPAPVHSVIENCDSATPNGVKEEPTIQQQDYEFPAQQQPTEEIPRIVSEGSRTLGPSAEAALNAEESSDDDDDEKTSPPLLFSSSSSEDEEDDPRKLAPVVKKSIARKKNATMKVEPTGSKSGDDYEGAKSLAEKPTAKEEIFVETVEKVDLPLSSAEPANAHGETNLNLDDVNATCVQAYDQQSASHEGENVIEDAKPPSFVDETRSEKNSESTPLAASKRKSRDDEDEPDNCVSIDPLSDRSTRAIVHSLIGVGSRVAVYWDDDDTYYPGTVTNRRSRGPPFFLEYDDGEEEWIDLRTHKFRILGDFGTRRNSISPEIASSRKLPASSPTRRDSSKPQSPLTSKLSTTTEASKMTPPTKLKRSESLPNPLVDTPPVTPTSEPRRTRSIETMRIDLPKKKAKRRRSNEDPSSSTISNIRVGTRVGVWWPEDEQYYIGTVEKERVHEKPFYLLYDHDNKGEWINFQAHTFCVMPLEPPEGKRRGRKAKDQDDRVVTIGCQISIWWSNISQFIEGTVTRKRGDSYFVKYEKQPGHWVELSKVSYRLEDPASSEVVAEAPSSNSKSSDSSTSSKSTSFLRNPNRDGTGRFSDPNGQFSKYIGKSPSKSSGNNFLRNPNRDGTGRFTSKAAGAPSSEPSLLSAITVGTRVSIYWEGDAKYYKGVVTRERKTGKKRHFLEYDDGIGSHWIDFADHWVRILSTPKRRNSATGGAAVEPATIDQSTPKRKRLNKSDGDDVAMKRLRAETPKKPKRMDKTIGDATVHDIETGSRLEVWWSGDEEYFPGTITKRGKVNGKYFIDYDDGTKEWINLNHQKYRVVRGQRSPGIAKSPATRVAPQCASKTSPGRRKKKANNKVDRKSEELADSDQSDGEDGSDVGSGMEEDTDYYKYDDFYLGAVDKIRLGSKLSVWWTAEQRYFDCTLKKIDLTSRKSYFLVYDDADEEWTDLRRRYFRILKR